MANKLSLLYLKKGASTAWVFEKVDPVLRVSPHRLKKVLETLFDVLEDI